MGETLGILVINAELPFGPDQAAHSSGRMMQTQTQTPLYDVRVEGDRIISVTPSVSATTRRARPGDRVIDAQGSALLPGLHDHHLHLFAIAAVGSSLDLSDVTEAASLSQRLRAAVPGGDGWVRATGYSEQGNRTIDRHALDTFAARYPVRLQHRSGALWILNSAALHELGLLRVYGADARDQAPAPLELDSVGYPTGRIWRGDEWLRELREAHLPQALPSLAPVGARLASLGITGVTDASPDTDDRAFTALARARRSGALPQRLQLLSRMHSAARLRSDAFTPDEATGANISIGPLKIVLADHALPSLEDLVAEIVAARATGRSVAVHSVTLASLALLLAAFDATPALPGDRIEHAAEVPQALVSELRQLGATVVTQPGFIAHRGDMLGHDLGAARATDLYRVGTLLAAGIPLALSSDAPYGPLSPWEIIAAAATRETPSGAILSGDDGAGSSDLLHPALGLAHYLAPLAHPGAAPRRVAPGAQADLALLHHPLAVALEELPSNPVRATMISGVLIYGE